MGGEGSILAMIISLKNNARRRYKPFERIKENQQINKATFGHKKLLFKKLPEAELQELKQKIRLNAKKARQRYVFIISIFSIGLMIVVSFLVKDLIVSLKKDKEAYTIQQEQIKIKQKQTDEKYMFFINDGYKWMREKHYHNAKFQFYEAYKLKPKEMRTQIATTCAYLYDCIENQNNCKKAEEFIRILIKKYPENAEVQEMYLDYQEYLQEESKKSESL